MTRPVDSRQPSGGINGTNGIKAPARPGGGASLKVVIRRLPPGLTQAEFESFMGEEWLCNGGRVNWMKYVAGKISSDIAKPSRPSVAYLRLTNGSDAPQLSEKVVSTLFRDAKNSSGDTALISSPCLEVCPYTKIPITNRRADPRQGTIDRDPEFVAFLESLTNPAPKPKVTEPLVTSKVEKITSTPLIDDLREKKAKFGSLREVKSGRYGHGSKKSRSEERAERRKAELGKESKSSKRKAPGGGEPVTILTKSSNSQDLHTSSTLNSKPLSSSTKSARGKVADKSASHVTIDSQSSQPSGRKVGRSKTGTGDTDALPLSNSTPIPTGPATARSSLKDETAPNGKGNKREPRASKEPRLKPGVASEVNEKDSKDCEEGISSRRSRASNNPVGSSGKSIASSFKANPPKILKKRSKEDETGLNKQPPSSAMQLSSGPPTEPAAMRAGAVSTGQIATRGPPAPALNEPKQAFIKFVGSSSILSSAELKELLSPFGAVNTIEVERRKPHAHAEFQTLSALTAAIKASPIKYEHGSFTVAVRRAKGGNGGNNDPSGAAGSNSNPTNDNGCAKGFADTASVASSVTTGRGVAGGETAAAGLTSTSKSRTSNRAVAKGKFANSSLSDRQTQSNPGSGAPPSLLASPELSNTCGSASGSAGSSKGKSGRQGGAANDAQSHSQPSSRRRNKGQPGALGVADGGSGDTSLPNQPGSTAPSRLQFSATCTNQSSGLSIEKGDSRTKNAGSVREAERAAGVGAFSNNHSGLGNGTTGTTPAPAASVKGGAKSHRHRGRKHGAGRSNAGPGTSKPGTDGPAPSKSDVSAAAPSQPPPGPSPFS